MGLIKKRLNKITADDVTKTLDEPVGAMAKVSEAFFYRLGEQHNANLIKHYKSSDWCMGLSTMIKSHDNFHINYGIFDESKKDYLVSRAYSCDRLRVLNLKTGKYGYLDEFCNLSIPCKYDDATDFYSNMAVVQNKDKFGVIGKYGEIIIPIKYTFDEQNFDKSKPYYGKIYSNAPFQFYIDSTILAKGDKWDLYSKKGELLYSCDLDKFDNDTIINTTIDKRVMKIIAQLEYAAIQLKELKKAHRGHTDNDEYSNLEKLYKEYAYKALRNGAGLKNLSEIVERLKQIPNRENNEIYNYVCNKKDEAEDYIKWVNNNFDPC